MDEWKRGWRVALGAASGSGLGISLFYYVFSLFTIPITTELGISRGEFANIQALLIVGALTAPFVGRWLDRSGFHIVFGINFAIIIAAHVAMATIVDSSFSFLIITLIYGIAGIGAGQVAYTRPVSAWFNKQRGMALGLIAIGPAVTTFTASFFLPALIATEGWRAGFWVLAALAGLIGLPLSLLLVRDAPGEAVFKAAPKTPSDMSYVREVDFWVMAAAMLCLSAPGAGIISQMSPLVQDEGIGVRAAGAAVGAYALGQVGGRIVAGWFLDRANPRVVALIFTLVPAIGLLALGLFSLPLWTAIAAVGLVGIQHGSEIDFFAFFAARRFGIKRYGTIYGSLIAVGWIGTPTGILLFGWLYTANGSYAVAEIIAAVMLVVGGILLACVKIDAGKTDTT